MTCEKLRAIVYAAPSSTSTDACVPRVLTEEMRLAIKQWVGRHPIPAAGVYSQELWNDLLDAAPIASALPTTKDKESGK